MTEHDNHQSGPRSKEPYTSMSDEEVGQQYSCLHWTRRSSSPEEILDQHKSTTSKMSSEIRQCLPFTVDEPYGDTERAKMDILLPESLPTDCPILVYIHGGYWQLMGREFYSYMAGPIHQACGGAIFLGYDLAPKVSIPEIVDQVKQGVLKVLRLAKSRGSRGVYLSGHSAGGHLAAMMLGEDWTSSFNNLIKGAILVSGVFDLRPLVRTVINEPLKLNEDAAWACSPFNRMHVDRVVRHNQMCKIVVAVGGDESPEFIRQSLEYHQCLVSKGMSSSYLVVEGEDHFTLVEKLHDADYSLSQALRVVMDL